MLGGKATGSEPVLVHDPHRSCSDTAVNWMTPPRCQFVRLPAPRGEGRIQAHVKERMRVASEQAKPPDCTVVELSSFMQTGPGVLPETTRCLGETADLAKRSANNCCGNRVMKWMAERHCTAYRPFSSQVTDSLGPAAPPENRNLKNAPHHQPGGSRTAAEHSNGMDCERSERLLSVADFP